MKAFIIFIIQVLLFCINIDSAQINLSSISGNFNRQHLIDAINAATNNGQDEGVVIIDHNLYLETSFPGAGYENDKKVTLDFVRGYMISISPTTCLSARFSIEAGLYKIFNIEYLANKTTSDIYADFKSNQDLNIVFEDGSNDVVYPEWIGAPHYPYDSSIYIQKLINDGAEYIKLMPCAYKFEHYVKIRDRCKIIGTSGLPFLSGNPPDSQKTCIFIEDEMNPIAFDLQNNSSQIHNMYFSDIVFSTISQSSFAIAFSSIRLTDCRSGSIKNDPNLNNPMLRSRTYVANSLFERMTFSANLRAGFDFNPANVIIRDCNFVRVSSDYSPGGTEYSIKAIKEVRDYDYSSNCVMIENCNFNELRNTSGTACAILLISANSSVYGIPAGQTASLWVIRNCRFEAIDTRIMNIFGDYNKIDFDGCYAEGMPTSNNTLIYHEKGGGPTIDDNCYRTTNSTPGW